MRLNEKHPELLNIWDFNKNSVDPYTEKVLGVTKYWWICDKCGSSYDQKLKCKISLDMRCPFCAGKKVNKTNCVLNIYPEIEKYWSDKNTIELIEISRGSKIEYIFVCDLCNEEYITTMQNWVSNFNNRKTTTKRLPCCHNLWTPNYELTAKTKRKITNLLSEKFPHLVLEWSSKNIIDFNFISAGSDYSAWWNCLKCGSEYQQLIYSKTTGKGCNFCHGHKVNETNSLIKTHPEILIEWDYNKNEIGPEYYTYGTNKKVYWICNKGHSWNALISLRCHITDKRGCPICAKGQTASKMEKEWLNYLAIPNEFREIVLNIENKIFYPDAFDKNTNTVYEFYGDFWHGNPEKFENDKINSRVGETFGQLYYKTIEKENILKGAGYNIVSIWESDWKKIKKGLVV